MAWTLSRFRAGDLVEVRKRDEILATLDQQGCVDGLPFMPEMLQYCGRTFRVSAVAHKTCETARKTYKGRRLQTTVHLAGLRCDGSAHGGCQADCNLFWRDVWLKRVDEEDGFPVRTAANAPSKATGCLEAQLKANTHRLSSLNAEKVQYCCQATELYEATEPLPWWDMRQYVYDVVTRNHSIVHVLRVLWLAFLKKCYQKAPRGYRLLKSLRDSMHVWLTGREIPDFEGRIQVGERTPTGRLDLKPGECVRIRSKSEIVNTLDKKGRNRGLYFDVEMAPYCGSVVPVRSIVTKIIDELTGEMRLMKEPCIRLEGVVCRSEYSDCRLMCPRSFPSYWREIWLERIKENERSN